MIILNDSENETGLIMLIINMKVEFLQLYWRHCTYFSARPMMICTRLPVDVLSCVISKTLFKREMFIPSFKKYFLCVENTTTAVSFCSRLLESQDCQSVSCFEKRLKILATTYNIQQSQLVVLEIVLNTPSFLYPKCKFSLFHFLLACTHTNVI